MRIEDWYAYICAEVIDPRSVLSEAEYKKFTGAQPNITQNIHISTISTMDTKDFLKLKHEVCKWLDVEDVNLECLAFDGYKVSTLPEFDSRERKLYIIYSSDRATHEMEITDELMSVYTIMRGKIELGPLRVRVEYRG